MLRRVFLALCLPIFLVACSSTAEPVWAPDEAVARATYKHDGPPSLTLVTMYNNRSNDGAHTALLINASERVLFDPAGTWYHKAAPERNDVHHGITSTMWRFYVDYHARESFRANIQTIEVSQQVAEQALLMAKGYGAVPKAYCANSTSSILRQLPGFETMPQTFYPGKLAKAFGDLPGVTSQTVLDDDSDDNKAVLTKQNAVQVKDWVAN